MKKFYAAGFAIFLALGFLIIRGERADVRYRHSACSYYLTFENSGPVSLAGFGGSRMLTAFDADDLARVARDDGHPETVVYNSAHSHYSLAREYVLVRDMLEVRQVRTIVVMVQPRAMDPDLISSDFISIARLKDIPTILDATSRESLIEGFANSAKVIIERLKFPSPVRSCHGRGAKRKICKVRVLREDPTRNCHSGDYRADLNLLLRGEKRAKAVSNRTLQWEPNSLENHHALYFIHKIQEVAKSKGTAVFFLFLQRTTQPFFPEGFSDQFKKETGAELLIPPQEMLRQLAIDGRRDVTHMNSKGRALFLPWLVAEIRSKCPRADGCL